VIARVAGAVLLVLLAAAPAGAEEPRSFNVLLLYTEPRLGPALIAVDEAFRSTLEAGVDGRVYFYTEFLDLSLFVGDVPQRELRDLLVRKYGGRRIDLVLAASSRALRIAVESRAALFPGAPIVFTAVDPVLAANIELGPDITGTWLTLGWASTVDAAMRLHPEMRRAVIVNGTGVPDRVWLAAAMAQLAPYQNRIDLTYLTDLRFADVLERVAALGPGSVVVVGAFTRDADNRDFVGVRAATEIARKARVPTYSLGDPSMISGVVGGDVVDFRNHGVRAAELATRVLKGERPAPTSEGTTALVFDWRQLKRWSIDERRLPPGSIVRFREPSIWDSYKRYIIGAAVVFVVQTGLIAGLLVSRAQRRRAQKALAERLRFERLVAEVSATFATLQTANVDQTIEHGLRSVVEELGLDRAMLIDLDARPGHAVVTHSWMREGLAPRPTSVEVRNFPWIVARLRQGEVVSLARSRHLPHEAAIDRTSLDELSTRSLLLVPFIVGGGVRAVGFTLFRGKREWPDELIECLRPLAEVFAHSLERRHSERAMRESEGRFRVLADSAPLMIWMASPDGLRSYFNERWLQVTGCRPPDVLGDGWLASVHVEDRDATVKAIHLAIEEHRPFTVEYRLRRTDGEFRWVVDYGVPIRGANGTIAGYIGSGVDVTELRAVQKALVESDFLRSAIFGSLSGHVVAVDRAGTIIAVNESWRRLAEANGAVPAEVSVGANYFAVCRRVSGMTDADARRVAAAVARVLAKDSERAHLEYPARINEEDRWFELTVEPFRRSEGGAIVFHADVTRRRQAEDEARQQREALAHTLRITTLGELAASIAHEINQPLTAIVTNARAMTRLLDAGSAVTDDIRAALRDVAADGKRASEIIRRLRALFRKEQGPLQHLNVNELTAEAVSLADYDLARKGIEIRSVYDPALPAVPVDPVQIQQVVLNLIINASEAIAIADDGPRLITVATAKRAGDRVEISVADSGVGVTEDHLELMFEPFVTTKSDGLGMGLAISRSIVQAHGGKIWATINVARGLTIHIELPTESPSAV
jgi:PAS domain S-box-containing protein